MIVYMGGEAGLTPRTICFPPFALSTSPYFFLFLQKGGFLFSLVLFLFFSMRINNGYFLMSFPPFHAQSVSWRW